MEAFAGQLGRGGPGSVQMESWDGPDRYFSGFVWKLSLQFMALASSRDATCAGTCCRATGDSSAVEAVGAAGQAGSAGEGGGSRSSGRWFAEAWLYIRCKLQTQLLSADVSDSSTAYRIPCLADGSSSSCLRWAASRHAVTPVFRLEASVQRASRDADADALHLHLGYKSFTVARARVVPARVGCG